VLRFPNFFPELFVRSHYILSRKIFKQAFIKMNILKLFFEEPTKEFNVREIVRLLKISPATASKESKRLVKENLLKKREERLLKLYKADLESYPEFQMYVTRTCP